MRAKLDDVKEKDVSFYGKGEQGEKHVDVFFFCFDTQSNGEMQCATRRGTLRAPSSRARWMDLNKNR